MDHDRTWSIRSAALGSLAWMATPWIPVGTPCRFGSLEHLFLLLPCVAAPIALVLLAGLLTERGGEVPGLHRVARRLQPAATALLLGSFVLPKGPAAGGLVLGWLLMAVLLAGGDLPRLRPRTGANCSDLSLVAAHIFLVVGSVWLTLFRLGVAPPGFSAQRVLLAALHFHFSGFTTQLLIAATGRRLPEGARRLRLVHRALALGSIAGMVGMVVSHVLRWPTLRFVAVLLIVSSTLALAVTSGRVALASPAGAPRRLLLVSVASLALAMAVALVYGLAEVTQRAWIDVAQMRLLHGLVNAFGFVLPGLCGHIAALAASRAEAQPATSRESPAAAAPAQRLMRSRASTTRASEP